MNGDVTRPGASAPPLTNAVLDFCPSRHGLHFPNRFEPGVVQRLIEPGITSMGLCGGMSFTVRDLFERGILPPADREPPARGTRRYGFLFRRQVESFDWLRLPLRFWLLAVLHRDPPAWWFRLLRRRPHGALSRAQEWPRIRAEIDAGRLAQIGLVRELSANPFRLTRNHQVLGYAYRVEPERVAIRIYDPNWPDADEVELRLDLPTAGPPLLAQTTGEPLHAFFLARFVPAEPRAFEAGPAVHRGPGGRSE